MEKDRFKIRSPKASDLNFIQSSFLKSMKSESNLGRSCSTRVFFGEFPKIIDRILSVSEILVACKDDEEDVIFGYLIFEPEVIHYAYVKSGLRRLDVARDLVTKAFPQAKSVSFSMNTNDAKKIREKYPELIFNPFVLYQKGA